MGYTHYWRRPRNLDEKKYIEASKDISKVVEYLGKSGLKVGDGMGDGGEPEITEKLIRFNGVGKGAHETFSVPQNLEPSKHDQIEDGLIFDFTKTAQKPYDVAVTASLVILKHYFPKIKVSSDGEMGDWDPGLSALCRALGDKGGNMAEPFKL